MQRQIKEFKMFENKSLTTKNNIRSFELRIIWF